MYTNNYFDNLSLELLKIIPTFIIGLITVYIAYRQHKLEKLNLDKELYEKRVKIYKILNKIFFHLVGGKKIDNEILYLLMFEISEKDFLFSEILNIEIDKFIINIWEARENELNDKNKEAKDSINKAISVEKKIKDLLIKEISVRYNK